MNQKQLKIKEINQKYTFADYLNNYSTIHKCVVAITDKQLVMLPSILDFPKTHWELSDEILNAMEMKSDIQVLFVAAADNRIFFDLPFSRMVSAEQFKFVDELLDQIQDYNHSVLLDNKAEVSMSFHPGEPTIEGVKKVISQYVTERPLIDNEVIIGRVAKSSSHIL